MSRWFERLVGIGKVLLLSVALGACRSPTQPPDEAGGTSVPTATLWRTPPPTVHYSEVRPAAAADTFYPAAAGQAAAMVHQFIDPLPQVDGEPIALIVPHAGWVYSGQVAAYAYKQIEGIPYDAIVIIGPNHTDPTFDAISVYAQGAFETPSGLLPIDEPLAAALLAADERIVFDRDVHAQEHSIEVQLPFLQRVCPAMQDASSTSPCAFVPIIIGQPTAENLDILTDALVQVLRGKKGLVIASSDLSHYPSYDDARRVDSITLAAIETLDPDVVQATIAAQMSQGIPNLVTCACGEGPIIVAMRVARALGADHVRVLRYANSGDASGDLSQVVGYAAVTFWHYEPPNLDTTQQAALLTLARQSIETYLTTGKRPIAQPLADPTLNRHLGTFVTLMLDGELRGCIGYMYGADPLYQAVARAAVDAAVNDPRFPALSMSQLDQVTIEVSVLSPFTRVQDPQTEIEIGRHGLYLLSGDRSGVLLPQVPVEQGWDQAEYLVQICAKAGLAPDCWTEATLYTFEAQVFGEDPER